VKIQLSVTIGITFATFLAASSAGAEDDPQAMVQAVRDAIPKTAVASNVKLTSSRGWERDLRILTAQTEGSIASFIEVTGPHDVKDTRFLFFERTNEPDEQHVYIPLIKRAMRIADDTRKQAFLGSDFYVSDLVAPQIDLYNYRFVGDEEVLGRKCRLVEAVPKDAEGEVYSKAIFAVDPADKLIVKSTFFDTDGELLKIWRAEKVERVDGHWTILQQTVENVQDKTTSTLTVQNIEYDAALPSGAFSRERLLR